MNAREAGFLLLSSTLGDPERRPLTVAQLRTLAQRVARMDKPIGGRDLEAEDLVKLGYDRPGAQRIVTLLSQTDVLSWYVSKGKKQGCYPVTRVSEGYPHRLRQKLGLDAPGCLWAKGDVQMLEGKCISLVGSRELASENLDFARETGLQAARQGYTLVSGNARGADRTAQDACLAHGGRVICVVADALETHRIRENVLYLSEEGFDLPFSAARALSRNRVIHSLSPVTVVAQCTCGKGGTWSGTVRNLQKDFSQVYCFGDNSDAFRELCQRGAMPITKEDLQDLDSLQVNILPLTDQ